MEEHRSHPDEPDQRWYPGERAYRAPAWDSVDKGPRVPEPRIGPLGVDPYGTGAEPAAPHSERHADPRPRRGAHADDSLPEDGPLDAVLPPVGALRDRLASTARSGAGPGGYRDARGADPLGSDPLGSDVVRSEGVGSDAAGSDAFATDARGSAGFGSGSRGSQGFGARGSGPLAAGARGSDPFGAGAPESEAFGSEARGSEARGSEAFGFEARGSAAFGPDPLGAGLRGSGPRGSEARGAGTFQADPREPDVFVGDPPGSAGGTPSPARPFDAPTGTMPPVSGAGPVDEPAPATGGPRFHSQPIERASLRRSAAPTEPVGDGVYRTRRPAVALVFALVTLGLEIVAVRMLVDAVAGGPVSVSGVTSGILLALGLPIFAAGFYALVTSGRSADPQALLRPPLGYLTVGLVLFLAAALGAA